MSGRAAVFLDRDGVLNRAVIRAGRPRPPAALEALEILPGVSQACARLKAAGYLLLGVTNQPDVARGRQERAVVESMNTWVVRCLGLDAIYTCYHANRDLCDCRKPRPGLLRRAAEDWGVDLAASVMVGDRSKDIAAGRAAGCRTLWIDSGHEEPLDVAPDARAASLYAGLPFLLPPKAAPVAHGY